MAIQFRRSALQVGVAALFASAFAAQAADIPQVKVTVNDKQCEPQPEGAGVGDPERRDGGRRA